MLCKVFMIFCMEAGVMKVNLGAESRAINRLVRVLLITSLVLGFGATATLVLLEHFDIWSGHHGLVFIGPVIAIALGNLDRYLNPPAANSGGHGGYSAPGSSCESDTRRAEMLTTQGIYYDPLA